MPPPNSPVLQQLDHLDGSLSGFHDQLHDLLYGEEYHQCVRDLQGDDLVWLVDYLDRVFDNLNPSSAASRKCLRELRSICGASGILPTSDTLSSDLLAIDPHPFTSGGYGDVYAGTLNGSKVCIKRMRVYTQDGPKKATKIFCQEAVIWKRLTHPNILPLLGITVTPLQLISSLMSGGNLPDYIEKNPDADRLVLLSDVAQGLRYLHSCNIIHGDLKGPNILVDNCGHARLADFGLARVTRNLDSIQSVSYQHGHTARWAAPEVLNEGTYSKEADIFAFAMVMIEIFTGAVPFSDGPAMMAMLAITQGRRPPRPTHPTFTEILWTLMQRCWDQDPRLRPEISEALQVLLPSEDAAWKRLIGCTLTMPERISLVTTIFSDPNQLKMAENLIGDDAQNFIDMIGEALDDPSFSPLMRGKCVESLSKMCVIHSLLPRSLQIKVRCDLPDLPHYSGGLADLRKGNRPLGILDTAPPVPATTTGHTLSVSTSMMKVVSQDGTPQDTTQESNTASGAYKCLDRVRDLNARNIEPPSYIVILDETIDGLPANSELENFQSQYQQFHPTMPSLAAHYASPTHNPRITSELSSILPPLPQLSSDPKFDTTVAPANQETSHPFYGKGSGGTADRYNIPHPHVHPHQYHDTRRASETRVNVWQTHTTGSPIDHRPVASSSQIMLEDLESVPPPGTDSDTYYSLPNTSASASWTPSEGLGQDPQRKDNRKKMQRSKQKADRAAEADQLYRVKELLGLTDETKIDTLERVVSYLGRDVPERATEPTETRSGKLWNPRAEQASIDRRTVTQLFEVIARILGYKTHMEPKRELILEAVAKVIERHQSRTQPPGPQGMSYWVTR